MALDKITSQSLEAGAVNIAALPDGMITAAKLHTTAITDKLGYTPYNATNPNGYLSSVAGSALTGTSLASGIVSSSLTSVGTLSSLRSNGFINLGTNTFTKANYSNGDLALDSGSTDTPGVLFYYANNKNWGIDSWNNGTSNVLRFVTDLNETGGAIRATLDNTGKLSATSFAGDGSQLTNIVNAALANNTITSSKMAISGFFKTQFAERSATHSLGGDSGWVDHLSMTISVGQTCNALFTYISSSSYESGAVQGFARILVDGNWIGRNSCVARQSASNHAGSGAVMWDYQNLPAGNHTITVQVRNNQGGTTWITPYWSDGGTSNILGAMFYV